MPKSVFTKQYELFRQILVDARLKNDLTQAELAQQLAKPQSFVSKYERGERRLDVVEFIQVAHALGLDPCEVVKRLEARRRAT